MRQTVIGIFNRGTEAKTAVKQLIHDGFQEEDIDISGEGIDDYSSSSSGKAYKDDGDSIGSFFRYLFGTGSEARDFSDVARRGCVVTVHVQSKDEAERAADLLDLYGAVDVNEKISYYRNLEEAEAKSIETVNTPPEEGARNDVKDGYKSRIIEKPVDENYRLRSSSVKSS